VNDHLPQADTRTVDTIADNVEVSVVIPCLNEAGTLDGVVRAALQALRARDIRGEVVVADNGSTDGSAAIAERAGARVVQVPSRGYGHALRGGIMAARGGLVIMGDADGQHDFGDIGRFIDRLREGFDLVQGCRLPSGGGRVMPGAMPLSHRWVGNPMFSWMARRWFGAPVHDVYCGMRGFRKDLFDRLDLRCTGMEFATEMILKASLSGARIAEAPITVHPDRRIGRPAHMRTVRDGWRTLRFFLLYSPRWLFLIPGALFITLGALGYALALPGVSIGRVTFEANTLLFASVSILCGYQSVLFAIIAKTFAVSEGLLPEDPRLNRFFEVMNLEKGLLVGVTALVVGIASLGVVLDLWRQSGWSHLEFPQTMRWVIPGATLTALGFQTILSSFLVSIAGLRRR
jgi:glycosyltransferase involved in cell wall biosynthesis